MWRIGSKATRSWGARRVWVRRGRWLVAVGLGLVGWLAWQMLGGFDPQLSLPVHAYAVSAPEPTPREGEGATARGERARTLVVFLTSDSGWLGLNRALPQALARAGYPTVGLNSLRYYLRPRTPEGASQDLARILETYSDRWGTDRWAIIGYSFGAGALPFLVNRLDDRWLETLSAVAFLAYPGSASFQFKPAGWLLHADPDARSATAEVARLPKVPSICIAGDSDPIRDCRSIESLGVERRLLALGHGLHPVTPEITAMVLATLDRGAATKTRPSESFGGTP